MNSPFKLDKALVPMEKLFGLLPDATQTYAQATPFPHIAIDDFLDEEIAEQLLREFPGENAIPWKEYFDSKQKKQANENENHMSALTRHVLYTLNSATFLNFLEQLTGIDNLIADPSFRGGGQHNIYRGGKLGVHVDYNKHERFGLDRRLNLLLYLNKDWKEEYGGHIELWSPDMARCEKRYAPVYNRAVLFSTTESSYHGHPDPLQCPENRSRKSLALYYYSNGLDQSPDESRHSTIFRERPGEQTESPVQIKVQKLFRKWSKKLGG